MSDPDQPDGTVSKEFIKDTVNSYIEQGDDRLTAMRKAFEDGIELIEEREP